MDPQKKNWTYESLSLALSRNQILIRVHTSSTSPLPSSRPKSEPGLGFDHTTSRDRDTDTDTIAHGNDDRTAGFTARNIAFRNLSPLEFNLATRSLRSDPRWAEGPYIRQTIIDHINNHTTLRPNPKLSRNRNRVRSYTRDEHEQSPWISTTQNLDWAIWYTAKLLSGGTHKSVHMTIISTRSLGGEISIIPHRNRPNQEWLGLHDIAKERYLRASISATRSREVLFYGRIFGQSIWGNMEFTINVSYAHPPSDVPTRTSLCGLV